MNQKIKFTMKIILILLAIFFVLKLLTKYLGPLLLKYLAKKVTKKFSDQFGGAYNSQETENNQTKVDPKKIKTKKNVGEYIDFEEIN